MRTDRQAQALTTIQKNYKKSIITTFGEDLLTLVLKQLAILGDLSAAKDSTLREHFIVPFVIGNTCNNVKGKAKILAKRDLPWEDIQTELANQGLVEERHTTLAASLTKVDPLLTMLDQIVLTAKTLHTMADETINAALSNLLGYLLCMAIQLHITRETAAAKLVDGVLGTRYKGEFSRAEATKLIYQISIDGLATLGITGTDLESIFQKEAEKQVLQELQQQEFTNTALVAKYGTNTLSETTTSDGSASPIAEVHDLARSFVSDDSTASTLPETVADETDVATDVVSDNYSLPSTATVAAMALRTSNKVPASRHPLLETSSDSGPITDTEEPMETGDGTVATTQTEAQAHTVVTVNPEQEATNKINALTKDLPRERQHGWKLLFFIVQQGWKMKSLTPVMSIQKGLSFDVKQIQESNTLNADTKIKLLTLILNSGILTIPKWGFNFRKIKDEELRAAHGKTDYGKQLITALEQAEAKAESDRVAAETARQEREYQQPLEELNLAHHRQQILELQQQIAALSATHEQKHTELLTLQGVEVLATTPSPERDRLSATDNASVVTEIPYTLQLEQLQQEIRELREEVDALTKMNERLDRLLSDTTQISTRRKVAPPQPAKVDGAPQQSTGFKFGRNWSPALLLSAVTFRRAAKTDATETQKLIDQPGL